MAVGSILENLSNQKLCYIFAFLGVIQLIFIAIGALVAPVPSTSMEFEMLKCRDKDGGRTDKWFHLRPQNCDMLEDLSEYKPVSYDLRDIVFMAQMPHARDGQQLHYSPWFQYFLGILIIESEYDPFGTTPPLDMVPHAHMKLEVRMGYRNEDDPPTEWKELYKGNVSKYLDCTLSKKTQGASYECPVEDLFEFGANNYPFYLLNIRLPIDPKACERDRTKGANCALGFLRNLRVVAIHQNGGFTLVWLWLKTAVFPMIVLALHWYNRRLSALPRASTLLERAILAVGVATAVLDAPIEWCTLFVRIPFMLLLNDIRQGLFYGVLFSFWLIFAGEHLIDDRARNSLANYWRNLTLIIIASSALLIYDIFERGYQLADPFYSIWATETGPSWAYATIYTAIACTVCYFIFLFYRIGMVWTTIRSKREAQLYRTSEHRRLKVEAVIFRFKFLMIFTVFCCALTIISYFMRQFGEASLHDDPDDSIMQESSSAFFTGVFGMWNIYVLLLISMYAPSHKVYSGASALEEDEDLLEGTSSAVESNPLTTFLKPATD